MDDWSAAGPAQVAERAGWLVPTARLPALRSVARALAVPLSLLEPAMRDFCPGRVDPEVVPVDRLGPADSSLPPGHWVSPC